MYITEIIKNYNNDIISTTIKSIYIENLRSYTKLDKDEIEQRLITLLNLITEAIENKDLLTLNTYVEGIAQDRYNNGYDFQEVHKTFNALEESLWNFIFSKCSPDDYGENLSLVSTVLGAAKEALAVAYINLSSKNKVTTFDVSQLFKK